MAKKTISNASMSSVDLACDFENIRYKKRKKPLKSAKKQVIKYLL